MASDTSGADSDLTRIAHDIQALKDDLARLIEHVKLYDTIASEGQRQAAALAHTVEEKPLASVLIAFAIGFVGGRILLR